MRNIYRMIVTLFILVFATVTSSVAQNSRDDAEEFIIEKLKQYVTDGPRSDRYLNSTYLNFQYGDYSFSINNLSKPSLTTLEITSWMRVIPSDRDGAIETHLHTWEIPLGQGIKVEINYSQKKLWLITDKDIIREKQDELQPGWPTDKLTSMVSIPFNVPQSINLQQRLQKAFDDLKGEGGEKY